MEPMTGLALSDTELRRALRQLPAPADRDHPLLHSVLVDRQLSRSGLADTPRHRWWALAEVVEGLVTQELIGLRGPGIAPALSEGLGRRGRGTILSLFDADGLNGSEELRAWTAVYCRYCVPLSPDVRLEAILGVHQRSLQRWLKLGLGLLRRRLTEAELAHGLAPTGRVAGPLARPSNGQDEPWADLTDYRVAQVARWTGPDHRLDERFVPPPLALQPARSGAGAPGDGRQFGPLEDVLAAAPGPAIALLGPPGSGKSTVLRHFEYSIAQRALYGGTERLTYYVPLNLYRARAIDGPPPEPWQWLAERWARQHPGLPGLADLLAGGALDLLLDGLNELPSASSQALWEVVGAWKRLLADVAGSWPGNRIVVACREADYAVPLSSPDLVVGVARVLPFDLVQLERFLSLHDVPQPARLLADLEASGLADLARVPALARLLADHVRTRRPERLDVAEFLTACVRQALRREVLDDNPLFAPNGLLTDDDYRHVAHERWRYPSDLPEEGLLLPRLSQLARELARRVVDPDNGLVWLPPADAAQQLDGGTGFGSKLLRAGLALGVLQEDALTEHIAFSHPLYQSYFAARGRTAVPVAL
jgi:hypothetical protein